jgi:hypothetical protein
MGQGDASRPCHSRREDECGEIGEAGRALTRCCPCLYIGHMLDMNTKAFDFVAEIALITSM